MKKSLIYGWNKVYSHLLLSFIPKETKKFVRYYKKKAKSGRRDLELAQYQDCRNIAHYK